MSSITLVQIAEKPITVAIEDAINSFTDKRQRRRPESFLNQPFTAKSLLTVSLRRPNSMPCALQTLRYAPDKLLRA
jgi:hypothetical protein